VPQIVFIVVYKSDLGESKMTIRNKKGAVMSLIPNIILLLALVGLVVDYLAVPLAPKF
jgi:hypothetical protein